MSIQNEGVPASKLYEALGRLYLQAILTDEANQSLSQQVAALHDQNRTLQTILNTKNHDKDMAA